MPDGNPRVGVVGMGLRGSMFAEAVRQHPRTELSAVCDLSPVARDRALQTLDVAVFADVASMLEETPHLSGAVIASPDDRHLEPALLCLEQGLDLLVEKPLATTGSDADKIVQTARRRGCRVSVGFENRWNPKFILAKSALVGGSTGRVLNQVISLNDTISVPTKMLSWAGHSSPAWFLMPHSLDIAMWLTESIPITVFARGIKGLLAGRGVDTWDAVSATFEMSDGSMASLHSSWIRSDSAPSIFDFRVEVQAENPTLELDIAPTGVGSLDKGGSRWLSTGVYRRRGRVCGSTIDMIDDWLDSLCGDQIDLPDVRQGAQVTEAIEAVHRSLEAGEPLEIPEVPEW